MLRNDSLFFAGFIPYLTHEVWRTTMFGRYIRGTQEALFLFLCLGMMFLKVMLYDHFTARQLLLSALLLVVGSLTYLETDSILYFSIMIMVIAAKDVDFDKILGVWLVVVITIMLLAFVASQLNIISNLRYVSVDFFTGKKTIRNSFGIIYPTDCAAHFFFCVLSLFYLRRNMLKWFDFILGIVIGLLVYYYCRARLDSLSILLTVILFLVAFVFKKNEKWKKLWIILGSWITPLACFVMIFLTYAYKQNGPLERLDTFISRRLFLGKSGMEEYGITFWGQKLKLIGNGGTTDGFHANYNFLDVSYINILIVGGVAFLLVFMFIYILIGYYHRKNTFLLCVLSMVAFNCAIAHHMTEIAYNIFTLTLFAEVTDKEYED